MAKYGVETHSYNVQAAKDYGIMEAVMLFNLRYWIDKNKKNRHNYREGRTWTYNSITAFQEQFPELSTQQIQRLLANLVEKNVLIRTNKFNKWKNDRTNWYAFVNESDWFDQAELSQKQEEEPFGEETLFGGSKSNDQTLEADKKPAIEAEISDSNAVGESGDSKSNDQTEKVQKNEVGHSELNNDMIQNRMIDVSESNEHYQIITKSLPNEEEEKEPVSTFELLFNKTAIKAYIDGTCDKLAFDFNNIDLVNKNIERLFRMFAGVDQPNQIHVDQIRNELLNDGRIELSYKVCWVIIQLAFMEYPGAEKKYQNVNSLLRKIGWKKNDFAKDLPTYRKQQETFLARQKQKADEHKNKEQELSEMLEWIKTKLEEHAKILTAAEVNEINKMLRESKVMSAKGRLEYFLYDVHKLEEAA